MNIGTKERISYIALAACILLWAFIPVATKKILTELDHYQMLFYSNVISFLAVGAYALIARKLAPVFTLKARDHLSLSLLGFLGTFLYFALLYGAIKHTDAAEGFILAYTWPIMVMILSAFLLGEELSISKVAAILICFVGIIVIATHGDVFSFQLTSPLGDALALVGALVWALFSVLSKKNNYDGVAATLIYFLVGSAFSALPVLFGGGFVWPTSNIRLWILFNGLLINGISYIFWLKALEYGKTAILSTSLYLTPFISILYVYIFLGDPVSASSVVGLVLIVTGILMPLLLASLRVKQPKNH
jgi:drug/metabolite transporter (DMT)-like permease